MKCSIRQRPLSLRISVTDKCQLRCLYCMPCEGVTAQAQMETLTFEEIIRFVRVLKSRFHLAKVHITGGEPLIRPALAELISMLACEGVADLALTTNGQLLAETASELKRAGLGRVNVSLDSLDSETYSALARGGDLQRVLGGIDAALSNGLAPVKINTVVLRRYNDLEVVRLARFAMRLGCSIRFLELMPIGTVRPMFNALFVPTAETHARLGQHFRLTPLAHKPGKSSRDFVAIDDDGQRGIIGFISPATQPFCRGCTRIRLTSTGQIISCLARGDERNVRKLLRSPSPQAARRLTEVVAASLDRKAGRGAFDAARPMAAVGG